MYGETIQNAKSALRTGLGMLRPNVDSFNVVTFDHRQFKLFEHESLVQVIFKKRGK